MWLSPLGEAPEEPKAAQPLFEPFDELGYELWEDMNRAESESAPPASVPPSPPSPPSPRERLASRGVVSSCGARLSALFLRLVTLFSLLSPSAGMMPGGLASPSSAPPEMLLQLVGVLVTSYGLAQVLRAADEAGAALISEGGSDPAASSQGMPSVATVPPGPAQDLHRTCTGPAQDVSTTRFSRPGAFASLSPCTSPVKGLSLEARFDVAACEPSSPEPAGDDYPEWLLAASVSVGLAEDPSAATAGGVAPHSAAGTTQTCHSERWAMANALVNGVDTEHDRRLRAVAAIVAAFRRRMLRLSTQEGAINAPVSEAIAATAKAQQGAAALFLSCRLALLTALPNAPDPELRSAVLLQRPFSCLLEPVHGSLGGSRHLPR